MQDQGFPESKLFFFSQCNALFIALLLMNYLDQLLLLTSDKFEPKFPELIRAEELGHLNFRAETELILSTSIGSKFLPHRKFSYFVCTFIMISYLILCNIKGVFEVENYFFIIIQSK
jgi:hypothetical protein